MNPTLRRTVHGALAGAIGAACMTAVRMLARRAKLIDQMVPQAVEAWAKHRLPVSAPALPSQRALHHVADQILHLGYGCTAGAIYGAALAKHGLRVGRVAGFGTAVWLFGSFVLRPGLRIMRPEWKAKPRESAVNLATHALYAGVLGLLSDEFEKQSVQPVQYPASLLARTG